MAVIAPKQNRGPGLVGVTRPATNAQPNTLYRFTALMDAADTEDPTLTLTGLKLLLDSRIVWQGDWTCGQTDRTGNPSPPHFTYMCPQAPPTDFRVEVTLPRVVNIGLDVSIDGV